jgi:Xaa-Pro aminopeptidase
VTTGGRRLDALRAKLHESECGALVVRDVHNVTYMSEFDGVWDEEAFSLLLISASQALVFTDSRYSEAAEIAAARSSWTVVVCEGDPWIKALEVAADSGAESVAVESSIPFRVVESARSAFSGEIVPMDGWVETLRATKEPGEIERIVAAQRITDDAFDHILGFLSAGMTETQIALELEFFMRSRGSEGVAFAPIVASGPNSARPHAHPGTRQVERGDLLKMDFGARVGGYCSDMTRTVVVGRADSRQREIYEAVLAANLAGIEAVRPGRPASEIDAAARGVIAARGFAENFSHGLGHGVGLDVHELPRVGSRSPEPVAVGNVVTIEPGVYVTGFGGVRIEDLVVVEEAGVRVLTRSAKELVQL